MSEVNDQVTDQFTKGEKIITGSILTLAMVQYTIAVVIAAISGEVTAAAILAFIGLLFTFIGLVFYRLYKREQKK